MTILIVFIIVVNLYTKFRLIIFIYQHSYLKSTTGILQPVTTGGRSVQSSIVIFYQIYLCMLCVFNILSIFLETLLWSYPNFLAICHWLSPSIKYILNIILELLSGIPAIYFSISICFLSNSSL